MTYKDSMKVNILKAPPREPINVSKVAKKVGGVALASPTVGLAIRGAVEAEKALEDLVKPYIQKAKDEGDIQSKTGKSSVVNTAKAAGLNAVPAAGGFAAFDAVKGVADRGLQAAKTAITKVKANPNPLKVASAVRGAAFGAVGGAIDSVTDDLAYRNKKYEAPINSVGKTARNAAYGAAIAGAPGAVVAGGLTGGYEAGKHLYNNSKLVRDGATQLMDLGLGAGIKNTIDGTKAAGNYLANTAVGGALLKVGKVVGKAAIKATTGTDLDAPPDKTKNDQVKNKLKQKVTDKKSAMVA